MYLPEEAHGLGWQEPGAAGYVYASITTAATATTNNDDNAASSRGAEAATVNGGRAVLVLPGPLTARPRLGARRLAQNNFSRIVPALAAEVTAWQVDPRVRAAALLRTQLVLVEEASAQHLHTLVPALCKVRVRVGLAG